MDCAIALTGATQPTAHPDQVVNFVDSLTLFEVASSASVFFTNPYSSQCGAITSCSLLVEGCGSAYGGSDLSIDSPGKVTSKQNVNLGFTITVCVECENLAGSKVQKDDWKVTQKPNCNVLTT
jgi:hypothetical protein